MPRSKSARNGTAPRWVRHSRWTGRDRTATRVACQAARAEHRAGHEPTAEPPTYQHRHNAAWIWH